MRKALAVVRCADAGVRTLASEAVLRAPIVDFASGARVTWSATATIQIHIARPPASARQTSLVRIAGEDHRTVEAAEASDAGARAVGHASTVPCALELCMVRAAQPDRRYPDDHAEHYWLPRTTGRL